MGLAAAAAAFYGTGILTVLFLAFFFLCRRGCEDLLKYCMTPTFRLLLICVYIMLVSILDG